MFEQEEDETDSGTMVRASGDETGTIRAVNTMSDGANTMIEHDGTLESQLGTMVINTEEEEEEGTMKSKKTSLTSRVLNLRVGYDMYSQPALIFLVDYCVFWL